MLFRDLERYWKNCSFLGSILGSVFSGFSWGYLIIPNGLINLWGKTNTVKLETQHFFLWAAMLSYITIIHVCFMWGAFTGSIGMYRQWYVVLRVSYIYISNMGIICMNMCVCKVSKCMYEHHFTKSIHTQWQTIHIPGFGWNKFQW